MEFNMLIVPQVCMKVEELYVPSARGEGDDSFWGMKNPFHKFLGNFYLTAQKA